MFHPLGDGKQLQSPMHLKHLMVVSVRMPRLHRKCFKSMRMITRMRTDSPRSLPKILTPDFSSSTGSFENKMGEPSPILNPKQLLQDGLSIFDAVLYSTPVSHGKPLEKIVSSQKVVDDNYSLSMQVKMYLRLHPCQMLSSRRQSYFSFVVPSLLYTIQVASTLKLRMQTGRPKTCKA